MDVFIIHSGSDAEKVSEKLTQLRKSSHHFNPLLLASGEAAKKKKKKKEKKPNSPEIKAKKKKFEIPFWKIDARKKIKKAQMIVFFVGESSHTLIGK